MNETSNPSKDNPMEQLSAADIMLLQSQGKAIPNKEPVHTNIHTTPEIDTVISSVIQAGKNQPRASGNQTNNLIAQVLKVYALFNGVAGILTLALLEQLKILAVVIALAGLVASFGIYAAGEALQLLQNISNNTEKTAKLLEQKKI